MAFFDWLTGNSNEKRDEKNRAKQTQQNLSSQQQQAFGSIMPGIANAQSNINGLFNPDAVHSNNAILDKSLENQHRGLDIQRQGYEQMNANPGYTPREAQDIKLASTSPVAGAYGSAQGQMASHAALTGNSAGLAPAQAMLARAKGRDISQAARTASTNIADQRIAGTNTALAGLGQNAQGFAGMGSTALNRADSERANAVAGLMPSQAMTNVYGTAAGGNVNLTGQQYQHATAPGGGFGAFLKDNVLGTVQALTGAGKKKPNESAPIQM